MEDKSMNQMSGDMKNYLHGPAKNKMIGSYVFSIIVNCVLVGIWAWFAFPGANMDTTKLWNIRTD
jgi:hypothetical protein